MTTHTDDIPPWLEGFCYLIPQSALKFGQDRRTPITHRPGIGLRQRDGFLVALPCTTQPNARFFHLRSPDDVLYKRKDCPQNSYVAHWGWHETICLNPTKLKKIGVLHHKTRLRMADWLRKTKHHV
jgi:hypothetical protein